jgi:RNA polymerase sigma-70 factor (ECF subfamily)
MNSSALKLVSETAPLTPPPGVSGAILSDEELFALCIDGQRAAFQTLVERYEAKAVFTARGFVGNTETAREVAQDAFLKVYAHRERFDLKRKFSTWFYRILRNQAVDRVRRQASGTPGAAVGFVMDWHSSTEKFRIVLALRDLEGLSCGEIGERTGSTPGTVRWRLHHARKLFKKNWERNFGKESGGKEL